MDVLPLEVRTLRDGQGRFALGQSGNPAGRKPGSRNQATRLREILADGDVERAIEVLRAQLQDGKGVAARFVLERLFPKLRDREIDLGLPPIEAGTTFAEMFDRVLSLMAAGEMTIDEASRMVRLIEQRRMQSDVRPVGVDGSAARPVAGTDGAVSPANTLQTAGDVVRPLNRHERRRAAAVDRATRAGGALSR